MGFFYIDFDAVLYSKVNKGRGFVIFFAGSFSSFIMAKILMPGLSEHVSGNKFLC